MTDERTARILAAADTVGIEFAALNYWGFLAVPPDLREAIRKLMLVIEQEGKEDDYAKGGTGSV